MIFDKALAFIKRDFLIDISYKVSFLMNITGIFFSVLTFYFISKLFGTAAAPYLGEYGGEYFPFVLLGIAFSTYLGVGLGTSASAIRQEQVLGTLESMLISPTRASAIAIYLSLWNFIFSSFHIFIYLIIGRLIFGLRFSFNRPLLIIIILFLSIMSFNSLSFLFSFYFSQVSIYPYFCWMFISHFIFLLFFNFLFF